MLKKLLRAARTPARAPWQVPPGRRVYAVGDIHGSLAQLDALIAKIDADDRARGPARTDLVFLGDLVDRGPDSAGVVERLLRRSRERADARFIMGNHEEMFLATIAGDAKAARLFCRVGGRETALSYGLDAPTYERMDHAELAAWLAAHVPADHVAFLSAFEEMVGVGDYRFVHAGVRPDKPLDEQRAADLRWIREPFLSHPKPLEAMIVHGHTISEGVDYRPHRIGIDTGAYEGGPLTALGLESEERWELSAA
ncbi:metallophosphoesterase family protein [Sphingomonas corticis]|jgi:serine/threonine protein phosphatase 1|uniref:Serine/threonine protein phosphatase n=1 Tax=Sphingomonas corticis TaxID=2722791 RepID=A0ABX1CMT3_9SPHN|nr:metallophosphoesterase family protein [Sphingomonas corticis]NJR79272.1 serine/threonine protein phosphatase [Sphingomonas corticis]